MKRIVVGTLLLKVGFWTVLPVQAQDACPYWFGNVENCSADYLVPSQFTELRDFIGSRNTFSSRQPGDAPVNPGQIQHNALEIRLLQKPRFVFWLQPLERLAGFKFFFEF